MRRTVESGSPGRTMAEGARPRSDQVEWGTGLGNAVALLDAEPEQLRGRGLEFASGHDDLDLAQVAFLALSSDRRYTLVRHRGAPVAGTEVLIAVPLEDEARDVDADLDELLERLGLSEMQLLWLAPPVQAVRATRGRSPHR